MLTKPKMDIQSYQSFFKYQKLEWLATENLWDKLKAKYLRGFFRGEALKRQHNKLKYKFNWEMLSKSVNNYWSNAALCCGAVQMHWGIRVQKAYKQQ